MSPLRCWTCSRLALPKQRLLRGLLSDIGLTKCAWQGTWKCYSNAFAFSTYWPLPPGARIQNHPGFLQIHSLPFPGTDNICGPAHQGLTTRLSYVLFSG